MKTISRQNIRRHNNAVPASAKFVAVNLSKVAQADAGESIVVFNTFRSLAAAEKDQRWTKKNCAEISHYEIYEIA